jgi:hypothetical protein
LLSGVPGDTAMGKTRMSAATHGHEQALRMEAGFFVGSTATVLEEAVQCGRGASASTSIFPGQPINDSFLVTRDTQLALVECYGRTEEVRG